MKCAWPNARANPGLCFLTPRTGFVQGTPDSSQVKYIPFDPLDVIDRGSTYAGDGIRDWLQDLRKEKVEPRPLVNEIARFINGCFSAGRIRRRMERTGCHDRLLPRSANG